MTSGLVRSLLFLGICSHATLAIAQSSAAFTATGNLTVARQNHTATLLINGKVLIAGGNGDASAELYDPSTGTFTATGSMTTPRSGHTATLLADGRVLIAGGSDLASAELYNSAIGTFTATGSMITPRYWHTATLMRDGRVLFAGGAYWNGSTYDVFGAELYDPSTGAFTATGNMHHPFWIQAKGTLLTDGTVLVGTELYQSSTGTFMDTGHPGYAYLYTATLLMDGTSFIAGGGDSDLGTCNSTTELYDPAAASFAAGRKMTLCRFSHTATLLPDGTVLIAGGASYDAGPYQANLASVEIFDFSTNTFGWIGNMISGRQGHTATLLPDGRVLIAGGVGAPGYSTLASAEVYTPAVVTPSPALFSSSGNGKAQAAIWQGETGQLVSSTNPAAAGDVLAMYATGLIKGGVIPPEIAVGSRPAEVLFFGDAPDYPGYFQVNFRMPAGVTPGSAIPVRLNYNGRPSNEVTIGVR